MSSIKDHMLGSNHWHQHAFVFKLNRSSYSCTQVLLRILDNLPLRCETQGPFVRLNDAFNRPQEMKNTAIQAQAHCLVAPLCPGCVFLNFVWGILTICEIPIVFFFSFFPPSSWAYCVSNGELYKQRSSPAVGWVNKRRSKGRR